MEHKVVSYEHQQGNMLKSNVNNTIVTYKHPHLNINYYKFEFTP